MKYTNHFGVGSREYLRFRPDYPEKLFVYLSSLLDTHDVAWDCGTGNGQAALSLSAFFNEVIATDTNPSQLREAPKTSNIHYYPWPAEKTHLEKASVDLITIAQALHWFDFTRFYNEAKRVLKPNGVIAAWCYSLCSISSKIDPIVKDLYFKILGDEYWPKERLFIDTHYETIPFPFHKLHPPHFHIEKKITFEELLGYLNTWSAVKEYKKRNSHDPIQLIYPELMNAWGDMAVKETIQWPIHLLVGKLN